MLHHHHQQQPQQPQQQQGQVHNASTPLLPHIRQGALAPVVPPLESELSRELVQAGGEFLGTFVFLYIGFAAIQASVQHGEHFLLSIALALGVGLACGIWLAYRISGGALNPAVVFALFLLQKITPRKAALYVAGELLGASAAAFVVSASVPGAWGHDFKGANAIAPGTTYFQGFLLEAFLTAGLVLLVLFLAVDKSRATFLAPLVIGLYVFSALIAAIPFTNASLNPARTFGAALVSGDWSAHWLFWLAPLTGASMAAGVYHVFKHFDYESLNPGQEDDHPAHSVLLP